MTEAIWHVSKGILTICLSGSTLALSRGHWEVTNMLMALHPIHDFSIAQDKYIFG